MKLTAYEIKKLMDVLEKCGYPLSPIYEYHPMEKVEIDSIYYKLKGALKSKEMEIFETK